MKRWLKRLLIICAAIVTTLLLLIGPIDRTPLPEQSFYKQMKKDLDTLSISSYSAVGKLKAGWGKVSITPEHSMPMAGYKVRNNFETVHDSLYARVIGINNGSISCYLISADLLLFPPIIKQQVQQRLSKELSGNTFLYFSATHTHNGIGGWNNSAAGNFILGNYEEDWVNETSAKLVEEIKAIDATLKPARLSYWETDASEYAANRLVTGAPHDGWLRGLKIVADDSSSTQLITFSAHATSISKKSLSLSGDYPAALVDQIEEQQNSSGMFMAGMVGSHRLAGLDDTDFDLVSKAGVALSKKILNASYDPASDSIEIRAAHIPIQFGPSQLRITKKWKLRNWVFNLLLDPLQGELTYLQLGNIILIGTPCDFSGELSVTHKLNELAAFNNQHLIITSFNGDYAGYITEDEHYDQVEKEEVMAMNWVGPFYGNYFSEMISALINKPQAR